MTMDVDLTLRARRPRPKVVTLSEAAAERVREMIEGELFKFENRELQLTVSIGVAECSLDGTDTARELLKRADANLYRAKREGRNRVLG